MKREGTQLEKTIAELEERAARQGQRADELRRLVDHYAQTTWGVDSFTFEDQWLALRALGVKVYANGEDRARWRFEVVNESTDAPWPPASKNFSRI